MEADLDSLLDLFAIAAVIAALVFLLRPRGGRGCADCAPAARGAETKVSLSQLRASAHKASGRE